MDADVSDLSQTPWQLDVRPAPSALRCKVYFYPLTAGDRLFLMDRSPGRWTHQELKPSVTLGVDDDVLRRAEPAPWLTAS